MYDGSSNSGTLFWLILPLPPKLSLKTVKTNYLILYYNQNNNSMTLWDKFNKYTTFALILFSDILGPKSQNFIFSDAPPPPPPKKKKL